MRLDLWLKGTLRTPDGGAAPAGAAIEALVTDCRNRQTCPVGSTWTDASGGFELRTDAELDAQMGRMPGESSALFVQARLDGALLATATVCWIEDLPAGRAVEVDLMAAKAIRVLVPSVPTTFGVAEALDTTADAPPLPILTPRTLPKLPVVEALRWV